MSSPLTYDDASYQLEAPRGIEGQSYGEFLGSGEGGVSSSICSTFACTGDRTKQL